MSYVRSHQDARRPFLPSVRRRKTPLALLSEDVGDLGLSEPELSCDWEEPDD
jgi:hypothetical protein